MQLAGREKRTVRRGVNLVELLLVVIVIGIVASIAIPRASRGSKVVGEPELVNSLAILRNAIEQYATEHEGRYPGTNPDGTAGEPQLMVDQLTRFTSVNGRVSENRDPQHPFGPYLKRGIPPMPVGANKGQSSIVFDIVNLLPQVDKTKRAGWICNPLTGDIIANAEGTDEAGQLFSNY